jgi:hypothetical protein
MLFCKNQLENILEDNGKNIVKSVFARFVGNISAGPHSRFVYFFHCKEMFA